MVLESHRHTVAHLQGAPPRCTPVDPVDHEALDLARATPHSSASALVLVCICVYVHMCLVGIYYTYLDVCIYVYVFTFIGFL